MAVKYSASEFKHLDMQEKQLAHTGRRLTYSATVPEDVEIATNPIAEKAKVTSNQKTFFDDIFVWMIGASVLLVLQLMCGTDPIFAALVGVFVILTGLTIQALGGLLTLPGISVFILALQHIIISQIGKVVFWQAADTKLIAPVYTILAYTIAMFSMYAGAHAARLLGYGRTKPLIYIPLETKKLFWLAVSFTVLSILRRFALAYFGVTEDGTFVTGGVVGPLKTITFLDSFAVATGTAYVILHSNKKRCVGWLNAVPILSILFFGIIGAQRADMAGGVITMLITCWILGFRLRFVHFATLGLIGSIAQFILFPFALQARNTVRTPDFATNVNLALDLLVKTLNDPSEIQESSEAYLGTEYKYYYFERPIASLDRYAVIITADAVINAALVHGTTEMEMISPGFQMLLPRFLAPDKPILSTSNQLARRAPGIVGDEDFTTQITLGFVCDAFTAYDWAGVAIIPFLIMLAFALIYSRLMGIFVRGNLMIGSLIFATSWQFSEAVIGNILLLTIQNAIIIYIVMKILMRISDVLDNLTSKRIKAA